MAEEANSANAATRKPCLADDVFIARVSGVGGLNCPYFPLAARVPYTPDRHVSCWQSAIYRHLGRS